LCLSTPTGQLSGVKTFVALVVPPGHLKVTNDHRLTVTNACTSKHLGDAKSLEATHRFVQRTIVGQVREAHRARGLLSQNVDETVLASFYSNALLEGAVDGYLP
jgi:hypothetical protein